MQITPAQPEYQRQITGTIRDGWTPVLVAVVNNGADLERARTEHWYRIPVRQAPRQLAAEYLALYQTGKFGATGRRINYFAPILRYHVVSRRQLLPEQGDHPRADEQYFKLELGELQTLQHPIPSQRQSRITFIYTTLEMLLQADDVNELWLRAVARRKLYAAIREHGLAVECWYPVAMQDRPEADLALFGPNGRLMVYIDEPAWEDLDETAPKLESTPAGTILHLDALGIMRDPEAQLAHLSGGRTNEW